LYKTQILSSKHSQTDIMIIWKIRFQPYKLFPIELY
jgi:hypothetical protein